MVPRIIPAIGAEIWGQMKSQYMAPDVAMMVLKAKVPTKIYAASSVYQPTATVHQASDALLMLCGSATGTFRHSSAPGGRGRGRMAA